MKMIEQPSRWSCLATSWAMVLDVPVEVLFTLVGHDGGEILYPSSPEPARRRSFHPAEFIHPALGAGFAVVPVERRPCWRNPEGGVDYVKHAGGNDRMIATFMSRFDGVITGETPRGLSHAVAWDHRARLIHDPSGDYRQRTYMTIHTFWAAVPREKKNGRS